ncbi:MAG: 3-isopropylmalate dehydratase large subunit [Rhodospirillales bacterium]|nr:3-isopropylmalate dehydratase large subunit [Rhodospirillales bacterium]
MPGSTLAEKILSTHAAKRARAGDIVVCTIDLVMGHDANGPMAIKAFENMGGKAVYDPDKVVFVLDHMAPAPYERAANLQALVTRFSEDQGTHCFGIGQGVCHQVLPEHGFAKPGTLILGSDSHTCTYGAFGAFATGAGATDIAAALFTGQNWFKVPETVRIELDGDLAPGSSAKDVILHVIGAIGADGGNYMSFEFYGPWLNRISQADHMTIANMVVEMGCKCGFICHANLGIAADPDAQYRDIIRFDLAKVEPGVAKPHTVDNYAPVSEVAGLPVQQGVIGSCTNGRIEDLRIAASILKGKQIAKGVRFLITPASRRVFLQAVEEGLVTTLIEAGAVFFTPGCGVCVGTHGGVPADGDTVIATTNRNFKGRMGNNKASIYLASPATVAASMLTGVITDPRTITQEVGDAL